MPEPAHISVGHDRVEQTALAGKDGGTAKSAAQTAAGKAATEANTARTLDTYTGNAGR